MPYHLATPLYLPRRKGKGRSRSSRPLRLIGLGWVKGLEPSTPGTTIRCSNQLSYTHQVHGIQYKKVARQKGFEPLAYCLEGSCSILLSYWRVYGAGDENRTRIPSLEGWCPDHCATPASALRGNRQLRYITMDKPICQAETRNFFLRLSCATSQRQPGGEKAPSICGSGQG